MTFSPEKFAFLQSVGTGLGLSLIMPSPWPSKILMSTIRALKWGIVCLCKDNFFQEQYIFKTKSSKNLQSLLYHSDLNICQDQCTQGSAGLLKKNIFLYFSLRFRFFSAIKNRIWFSNHENIQNCQEHFFTKLESAYTVFKLIWICS